MNGSRHVHEQYWSLRILAHNLDFAVATGLVRKGAGTSFRDPADRIISVVEELKVFLPPQVSAWCSERVESLVESARNGEPPTEFLELMKSDDQEVQKQLAALPGGLEKARDALRANISLGWWEGQMYDAAAFLRNEIDPAAITKVVAHWKAAYRDLQRDPIENALSEGIWWSSRDGAEILDLVARYRFIEVFGLEEFGRTKLGIEYCCGTSLIGDPPPFWLFLVSRSRALSNRVHHYIRIGLDELRQQLTRHSHICYSDNRPNIWATASACAAILRLSSREDLRRLALEAVRWLCTQQSEGGSWPRAEAGPPSLLTTVVALECLRLSDSTGFRSSIKHGEEWVLTQQQPTGVWSDDLCESFFVPTVLVLEYFERSWTDLTVLPRFARLAQAFYAKSEELADEDDEPSRAVSAVTLYQALELFMYAMLTSPDIGVSILQQGRTIGLAAALQQVNNWLTDSGKERVPENRFEWLKQMRDSVVHRGGTVAQDDLSAQLRLVRGFMDRFSDVAHS